MLEQIGGVSGLVYSTVPVVVFVPVNSFFDLRTAIYAALGVAALLFVVFSLHAATTRALGAGMEPDADFWIVPAQPREKLLVCSDGLNGELTDDEIRQILESDVPIDECADQLVAGALNAGGRDNVTVIVVDATTEDTDPDW